MRLNELAALKIVLTPTGLFMLMRARFSWNAMEWSMKFSAEVRSVIAGRTNNLIRTNNPNCQNYTTHYEDVRPLEKYTKECCAYLAQCRKSL